VGLARRRIFYWRLAPLPFTGGGWKLRSSSQRWTGAMHGYLHCGSLIVPWPIASLEGAEGVMVMVAGGNHEKA